MATVVPFTALIAYGLWSQWREDVAEARERAISLAREVADQLDDHLDDIESVLTGVVHAVSVSPNNVPDNDALLRRVRDDFESQFPGLISNIVLFSPEGDDLGRAVIGPRRGEYEVRDRQYFQQALSDHKSFAIGEVVQARGNDQWVVHVAHAVEDQNGQVRGVLAIGIVLENLQSVLKISRLPRASIVTIVDQKGIVLARSADFQNWVGRDLGPLADLSRSFAEEESADVVVWPDQVKRMTGSGTTRRAAWLALVGLPTHIAFEAMMRRLSLSALFVSIAGIAAFAIAWMLSGRIVRPLRQLGKDAAVLASGKLSHRTAIATRDEVGAVATAFNLMASSLEHRQEEAWRSADELRQAKDTLAAVIDASQVAIVCSDPERRIVLWNHAAVRMFGHTAAEAIGHLTKIVPSDGHEQSKRLFGRAIGGETVRDVEVKRMRKDGSLVDVRVSAAPMYHCDGAVRGVAWAYQDITERNKAEEQLRRIAHFDPLTGLPNRLSLEKELGHRLCACRDRPTAVALFDLDDFKDVNDMLGHSAGDELLIEVGDRLTEVAHGFGWVGPVCRLGGDEFIVLMPDCGDPRVIAEVVESMLKRIGEPVEISGQSLQMASCAGIAIGPADGANVNELIANADLALYRAKSVGGRTHRLFVPVMRAEAQARRVLTSELRRAIDENEFELHFQPQIRLVDNAVVGAEALLRWRHPERGVLAPSAFIDALTDSAVAPSVGRWVLRTSCEQMSSWRARGLPLTRIGVNLFPAQAHNGTLVRDVEEALRGSGLAPQILELEITENIALNYQDAIEPLKTLHDFGVELAVDDFGTGYASLSYLTRLPLARIKIDRSFIATVSEDAENSAIVRSLIVMAHNLGLEVIAEGVETEAQANFLRNERCEEAQGYLYGKPLSAAEFEHYVATRPSTLLMRHAAPRQARVG
ncbi:MAG: EAL domain-containing protein [Bradyrhizobiaceae bacterium]|nr:EAL domain-containing protein [Bradyrhizobiaceae bacterium]